MRAAIVGLGWWGQSLTKAGNGKGLDFVLGTTRTRSKAEEFAKSQNIKLVDSYDEVLADKSVQAVVLATPHSQHGEQVRKAAAAGKHAFVEKPFTLTSADAEQTIDAVKKAGTVLAVGFNRRFHPSMMELKAHLTDGRLGAVNAVIGEQSAYAAYAAPSHTDKGWRHNPEETPAGAMTGIGIHTLDSMIGLVGNVTEVHCIATRRSSPHVDDTTTILLRFENGATGVIYCSMQTAANYRLALYGSKGLGEILKPTLEDFRFTPAVGPGLPAAQPESIQKPGFDTLQAELSAFAQAAGGGKPYPVPLPEVLHGVKAFEAVVKSAKEGKPVKVN